MTTRIDGSWELVDPAAVRPGDEIVVGYPERPFVLKVTQIEPGGKAGFLLEIPDEDDRCWIPAAVLVLRRVDNLPAKTQGFLEWLVAMDDPEDVLALEERRRVGLSGIIDRAKTLLEVVDDGEIRRSDTGAHLVAELNALYGTGATSIQEITEALSEDLWRELGRRVAMRNYLGVERVGMSLHDLPLRDHAFGGQGQGAIFTVILARNILRLAAAAPASAPEDRPTIVGEMELFWLLLRGYVEAAVESGSDGHWMISIGNDGDDSRIDLISRALTEGLEVLKQGRSEAGWRANTGDPQTPTAEIVDAFKAAALAARDTYGRVHR